MDHYADLNLTDLHAIRTQHDLPGFVKSAELDRDAVAALPSSSFADPATRQFPCHTRADTYLSYAYFLKHANEIPSNRRPDVWGRLRKYAHYWAIFAETEKLTREHEKQASRGVEQLHDDSFAIVEEWGGQKYRALPLLDATCVKGAAAHLQEYKDRYPMAWRQRAAARIVKKARVLGVDIGDYVVKASGETSARCVDIARHMFNRVLLINPKHRGDPRQISMAKAAKLVASSSTTDRAKVASILDAFDRYFDLTRFYGRGMPTPEEVVYGSVAEKSASDIRSQIVRLMTGSTYTKAALEAAGLEPYAALGDDFVGEVSDGLNGVDIEKVSTIVPTLPLPDARLLDRALREVGVKNTDTIRKEAGLPADMSRWSEADWSRFHELVGA